MPKYWQTGGVSRALIRFRATRAAPPGMVAGHSERRALYSAALQQSEDLFEAARAVGPLARPIPLFYAMSQAGRAIAAAWLEDDWQVEGHGLTQDRKSTDWKTEGIPKFRILPQGKPGVFGAVAEAQGSGKLRAGVELGALWSALPGDDRVPLGDWLLAMPVWPQTYLQGQEALARIGATQRAYVFLQGQADEADPQSITNHLSNYPAADGSRLETPQNLLQRGWTPWGYGPALFLSEPASLGITGMDGQGVWARRAPAYRYEREHWLVPVVGDASDRLSPMLLWWALLFGMSLLARYEPVAWRGALDPDQSELAFPLERLLDEAMEIVPDLLHEAITHQPALLPARA